MSNNKIIKEETGLKKWGNSQGIRINKAILNELGWSDEENLILEVDETYNFITIKRADNKNTFLESLFEAYDGEYKAEEIDMGGPEGNEIW